MSGGSGGRGDPRSPTGVAGFGRRRPPGRPIAPNLLAPWGLDALDPSHPDAQWNLAEERRPRDASPPRGGDWKVERCKLVGVQRTLMHAQSGEVRETLRDGYEAWRFD